MARSWPLTFSDLQMETAWIAVPEKLWLLCPATNAWFRFVRTSGTRWELRYEHHKSTHIIAVYDSEEIVREVYDNLSMALNAAVPDLRFDASVQGVRPQTCKVCGRVQNVVWKVSDDLWREFCEETGWDREKTICIECFAELFRFIDLGDISAKLGKGRLWEGS